MNKYIVIIYHISYMGIVKVIWDDDYWSVWVSGLGGFGYWVIEGFGVHTLSSVVFEEDPPKIRRKRLPIFPEEDLPPRFESLTAFRRAATSLTLSLTPSWLWLLLWLWLTVSPTSDTLWVLFGVGAERRPPASAARSHMPSSRAGITERGGLFVVKRRSRKD
jgi:hypothetical protein